MRHWLPVVLLFACTPSRYDGQDCSRTGQCALGLACYNGTCRMMCDSFRRCGTGLVCTGEGFCAEDNALRTGCTGGCGDGLSCVRGVCTCTPSSCPDGCCVGGACLRPNVSQNCGLEGHVCRACTGNTPACIGGECRSDCADNLECQNGCCDNTSVQCLAGLSDTACGRNGACVDCTTSNAGKTCVAGECGCRTVADCGPLQACGADGKCHRSCSGGDECNGGCCAGGMCIGFFETCPSGETCRESGRCGCTQDGDCDDSSVCTVERCTTYGECDYAPADAGTVLCRGTAAGDLCDAPEYCTGGHCPADARRSAGEICRVSAGPCDAPETCDGSGKTCAPDVFYGASTVCRPVAPADLCDVAEYCNGTTASCPANTFKGNGVVCRASADGGVCDNEDVCSGTAAGCPDVKAPAGIVCGGGMCDGMGVCQ